MSNLSLHERAKLAMELAAGQEQREQRQGHADADAHDAEQLYRLLYVKLGFVGLPRPEFARVDVCDNYHGNPVYVHLMACVVDGIHFAVRDYRHLVMLRRRKEEYRASYPIDNLADLGRLLRCWKDDDEEQSDEDPFG